MLKMFQNSIDAIFSNFDVIEKDKNHSVIENLFHLE